MISIGFIWNINRIKGAFMYEKINKAFILPAAILVMSGCAQGKGHLQPEERQIYSELQKSVMDLTKKMEELSGRIALLPEKAPSVGVEAEGAREGRPQTGGPEAPEPVDNKSGGERRHRENGDDVDILESPGDYRAASIKAIPEKPAISPLPVAAGRKTSAYRPGSAVKADYERAYKIYEEGNPAGAIIEFGAFISRYPDTNYTDNAYYWRGESYYALGEFEKARDEFEQVINRFPAGNKAPDAMLKLAYSYLKMGRTPEARQILKKVMDLYPFSISAKMAAQKINSL